MSFKVCCPTFEDSGLGVVLPPVWQIGRDGQAGFENLRPDTAQKKERLGLQSLLNFSGN